MGGPASCTKCPVDCHHTITSPKTHAGMCSKEFCPMCKPKECCGEGHKHYVVNSESLAGVCVRHNDDCNAICVPAQHDPTKRSVCSKGCNRIVKVPNANATKDETDMAKLFDIVVCQVRSRVPLETSLAHHSELSGGPPHCVRSLGRCLLRKLSVCV